ncbi:MAG: rRNA maturation RNase YbeY [Pyrinomonadaceae bacterium]
MINLLGLELLDKKDAPEFEQYFSDLEANISELCSRVITVVFVNDNQMISLNSSFRNKNATTDVLSFPYENEEFEENEEFLGEVVISVEQAQKQATENDLDLGVEIKQLILHGILHLLGYDHETDDGEMNSIELCLRDKIFINQ